MDEEKKQDEVVDETSTENEEYESQLDETDRKIKNLISAVILLSGLFVGSLFVDIVQLARGGGFSQHALNSTDVFQSNGKTWVAYTDPLVKVQVVTDDSCGDACKPDEVLVGLKQALPTMVSQKVDVNSPEGKALVAQFNLKTLPAFIFSQEIEQTDLFSRAQPFLEKQGNMYAIKSAEAGFPVGKYISAPQVTDGDIILGSKDASVKVVAFSDFQNQGDAQFYTNVITQLLKDYGDKVAVVFKNYLPQNAPQAMSAALASECANAQGKFQPYAQKLYATQKTWGTLKDTTATFKGYAASLGLNAADFNKCLDSKQFQDQVTASLSEGQSFGISATPTLFVGTEPQAGSVKYDDVKKAIDAQLGQQ